MPRWPKRVDLMDASEHDVLAYMVFPRHHRTKPRRVCLTMPGFDILLNGHRFNVGESSVTAVAQSGRGRDAPLRLLSEMPDTHVPQQTRAYPTTVRPATAAHTNRNIIYMQWGGHG